MANRVTIIVNADGTAAIEGIQRVEGSTKKLGDSTQNLERRTRGITGQIRQHWLGVSAAILGTYFAVKKAMDIGETFLRAADTTEQFETRLRVLLGSASEGNRLFQKMSEYANKVPFEFEKVMESATMLATVMKGGTDEIARWMPLIGDLAAAFGLSIEDTTMQVVRMFSSGAAAADMFRERGVLAMFGFKDGVHYSAEETRRIMMEQWQKAGSQFKGATAALANTWDGLMSMLKDKWFHFRVDVMNAAVFDYLKAGMQLFLKYLDQSGKSSDDLARSFSSGIVAGMKEAVLLAALLVDSFRGQQMIFQGLKLAWAELSKAIWETINWLDEKLLALSQLPVFDKLFDSSKIKKFMDESQVNVYMFEQMADRASERLEELASKGPLPAYHAAQRVIAQLDEIVQKAREAKAAAEAAGGFNRGDEAAAEKEFNEQWIQGVIERLDYIEQEKRAMGELWALQDAYRQGNVLSQQSLQELVDQGMITWGQYLDGMKKIKATEIELEQQVTAMRYSAMNNAVDLLQVLGARSKAAAIAALVLQKGLAIAQTFIAGKAAEIRALAELGPVEGIPMAAAIATWTKINMALIAATGLAQAMSMGASPPAAGGTAGEPLPQSERMTAYEKEYYGSGWRPGQGQQAYQAINVTINTGHVYADEEHFKTVVTEQIQDELRDPRAPLSMRIVELVE